MTSSFQCTVALLTLAFACGPLVCAVHVAMEDTDETTSLLALGRRAAKEYQEQVVRLEREKLELQSALKLLREEKRDLQARIDQSGPSWQDIQELNEKWAASVDELEELQDVFGKHGGWAVKGYSSKLQYSRDISVDSLEFIKKSHLKSRAVLVNSSNFAEGNKVLGGDMLTIVNGSGNTVTNNTVVNNNNNFSNFVCNISELPIPGPIPHPSLLAASAQRLPEAPRQSELSLREVGRLPGWMHPELQSSQGHLDRLRGVKERLGVLMAAGMVERWAVRSAGKGRCKRPKELKVFISSLVLISKSKIKDLKILINSNNTFIDNKVLGRGTPIVQGQSNSVNNNIIAWNNNTFFGADA